jgi:hypothetical protein
LALKCAEQAIVQDRKHISSDNLQLALRAAARDVEGTLKRIFDDAVRSSQTDMLTKVVRAAARCTLPEFTASELRKKIKQCYEIDVKQQGLNNHFKRLVSGDRQSIFHRKSKGVYCFSDPRMPSYILIEEGTIE